MDSLRSFAKRFTILALLGLLTTSLNGCRLVGGFAVNAASFSKFWLATPPIPVSPYFQQMIEDTYWNEERYGKVPVLDPVEGENAPLQCMDTPSADEIIRALSDDTAGGFPFLAETTRNNVRMVVEPIVDKIDDCRFYPMVGPARLHHCHYKCTVYFDKVIRSDWPIPFTHKDSSQEVVYIDHDHLIRCAGPDSK